MSADNLTLSTDIYDIVESIENVKAQYIPESEETLAADIYGYLGAIEARKTQASIIVASELSNEIFAQRAKYKRNLISHAITHNITDINAIPAKMNAMFGIRYDDIMNNLDGKNTFIVDRNSIIQIASYTFHVSYPIMIKQALVDGVEVFTAQYIIEHKDPNSTITSPYLPSPVTQIINKSKYILISCTLVQMSFESISSSVMSTNLIENKMSTFIFDDQLAYFEVFVRDNYITPIFEGAPIPPDVDDFCYYTFMNEKTVRIKFDRTSFTPKLNDEIIINIYTTTGSGGNFIIKDKDRIYGTINSEKYGYTGVDYVVIPLTDSRYGEDQKSKEKLRKLVPKEALARGTITTTEDLNNFFNMINSDSILIKALKKIDNQRERTFYAYFVMKDSNKIVVPSNTTTLYLKKEDLISQKLQEAERLLLPAGTVFGYDSGKNALYVYDDAQITTEIITYEIEGGEEIEDDKYYDVFDTEYGDLNNPSNFVYTSPFTISINKSPLYMQYFLTKINQHPYLDFEYINLNSSLSFIASDIHWTRKFYKNNGVYDLSIQVAQNINKDMGVIKFHDLVPDSDKEIVFKVINLYDTKLDKEYGLNNDNVDVDSCYGRYYLTNLNLNTLSSHITMEIPQNESGYQQRICDNLIYDMGITKSNNYWIYTAKKSRLGRYYPCRIGTARVETNNVITDSDPSEKFIYRHKEGGIIRNTIIKIRTGGDLTNPVLSDAPAGYTTDGEVVKDGGTTTIDGLEYEVSIVINKKMHHTSMEKNNNITTIYHHNSDNEIIRTIVYTANVTRFIHDPVKTDFMSTIFDKGYMLLPKQVDSIAAYYPDITVDELFFDTLTEAVSVLKEGGVYYVYTRLDETNDIMNIGTINVTPVFQYEVQTFNYKWISYSYDYKEHIGDYYENYLILNKHYNVWETKNQEYVWYRTIQEALNANKFDTGFYYVYTIDRNDNPLFLSEIYLKSSKSNDGNYYYSNYAHTDTIDLTQNMYDNYFDTYYVTPIKAKDNVDPTKFAHSLFDSILYNEFASGDYYVYTKSDINDYPTLIGEITIEVTSVLPYSCTYYWKHTEEYKVENNMRVIALFYKDGAPYRWEELGINVSESVNNEFTYTFDTQLVTNDIVDLENNIYIDDTYVNKFTERLYGYFNANTAVKFYVFAKLSENNKNVVYDHVGGLNLYYPGIDPHSYFTESKTIGYTLCNIYGVIDGIDFYINYGRIMNSVVTPIEADDYTASTSGYKITTVPVVGYRYAMDEEHITEVVDSMELTRAYIKNVLSVLENTLNIDFKFFNTFGPAKTYRVENGGRCIDRINLSLHFNIKLAASNDLTVIDLIKADIKEYIENLNYIDSEHISLLITKINTDYDQSIEYFDFIGFNEYDSYHLHIYKDDDEDLDIRTAPELLNIHMVYDNTSKQYKPDINIEIIEN